MKDEVELEIGPGGTITTLYQSGIEDFATEVGATITGMRRLTRVEWEILEDGRSGWTVRSECNRLFALRFSASEALGPQIDCVLDRNLVVFKTREEALAQEEKYASAFINFRREYEQESKAQLEELDKYLKEIEEARRLDPFALVQRLGKEYR